MSREWPERRQVFREIKYHNKHQKDYKPKEMGHQKGGIKEKREKRKCKWPTRAQGLCILVTDTRKTKIL